MKNTLIGTMVTILTLFTWGGCTSAPPPPKVVAPSWVMDKDSVYPNNLILMVIGTGADLSLARADGLAQLSNYFGVSIKAFSEGAQAFREEQNKGVDTSSLERSIVSKITSNSSSKLFAVEYGEAFNDTKQMQIPVFMDRRKAKMAWDQEITTALNRYNSYVTRAGDQGTSLLFRFAAWKAAQALAVEITALNKTAALISTDEKTNTFNPNALADLSRGLVEITGITVSATGLESDRIRGVVTDRLSQAGFTTSASSKLELPVKITMALGDGGYGLSSASWTVDLALMEKGEAVFNLLLEGKATGSSPDSARSKALKDLTAALDEKFIPKLIDKLTSSL